MTTPNLDAEGELAGLAGVRFAKLCGAGNDFVVVDNRQEIIPEQLLSSFTRRVCRRRLSVGADGAVFISDPPARTFSGDPAVDFRWRYFNADGGEVDMCGNGAMCGARFAYLEGISGPTCRFLTMSGPVAATVDPEGSGVRLEMPDPRPIETDISLNVEGLDAHVHAITVGVPHAVWFSDDADSFAGPDRFEEIGRAVRYHDRFAPAGTNFNVVSTRPGGALRMRTYERGVEAETLACGTGAVASAIVATALGVAQSPVLVVTSSGATLTVSFEWDGARARAVALEGQARVIVSGNLRAEAFDSWETS